MTARACPRWMSAVLALAGVYNLGWAAWMVGFPEQSFARSGMEDPAKPFHYPQLWQGIGTLVGVLGVGYLIAARDPVRHRGLVVIGLVSKVLGGLGSLSAAATGPGGTTVLLLSVCNDIVWWVPFALILRHAYRAERAVP